MKNSHLSRIITEELQRQLNEAITLRNEASNIENITDALQAVYNRLMYKGVSKNEIGIIQISKIIQILKRIQHSWKGMQMW